jgi:hypothetical protein
MRFTYIHIWGVWWSQPSTAYLLIKRMSVTPELNVVWCLLVNCPAQNIPILSSVTAGYCNALWLVTTDARNTYSRLPTRRNMWQFMKMIYATSYHCTSLFILQHSSSCSVPHIWMCVDFYVPGCCIMPSATATATSGTQVGVPVTFIECKWAFQADLCGSVLPSHWKEAVH